MKTGYSIKTWKMRLFCPEKQMIETTEALYQEAVAFYYELLKEREELWAENLLTIQGHLEKLTVPGRDGREPKYIPPGGKLPVYFRRSAMNKAAMAVKTAASAESFPEKIDANITFFKGMYRDLTDTSVVLNDYIKSLGPNIIVDNAQAYFQEPIDGFETLYTCRKFFGVPDGAVLYTDKQIEINEVDQSYTRMHFLLGRYEKTAGEFYQEYVDNNHLFKDEPIKRMSRLTENLLHGLDYELVKTRRTENFAYLHEQFKAVNQLKLICPSGAFMYPLYLPNGAEIRKKLQAHKIFIPTLWPAVFNICDEGELEYNMAKNILPIPVDQRYTIDDMNYIVNILETMR